MKRTLSMITLAAFATMLLGSCSKINERIDNLEKKVDGLENEEIATIKSQVESIESSISDLKSIRDKVQAMSDPATGLSKRIEELEAFASDVKKNYATQDWAKTTLVTMDEYEKTCDTVAKIAARVEGFDSDIKACADSLKRWVNGKFGGYYDIAEIDAKLAELQEQVDGVDSLSAELAKTKTEIDTAKAAIRAEYRAAIDTAIKTCEGNLTKQIQDEIEKVNETVTALAERVGTLEFQVRDLLGRVGALEGMIQSVTILPAYSDGSVKVEDDTLFIECLVNPAKAVWGLTMKNFTVYLHEVATKAVNYREIRINDRRCFSSNPFSGTVSIKVSVKDYLPENIDESSLVAALNVKYRHSGNLTSDYTTEFVPVTLPVPPEGFVDLGVKNADGKPLYWATCNLGADKPEDSGDFYMWGAKDKAYESDPFTLLVSKPSSYVNSTWDKSKGFAWENCNYTNGIFSQSSKKNVFTKYVSTNNWEYSIDNTPDGKTVLDASDDAATAKNAKWRTPTPDDFAALKASCYWVYYNGITKKYNGKAGYIVYKRLKEDTTEKTANKYTTSSCADSYNTDDCDFIFFPIPGYISGTGWGVFSKDAYGYYWTNTLSPAMSSKAYYQQLGSTVDLSAVERCCGCSIRPVTE